MPELQVLCPNVCCVRALLTPLHSVVHALGYRCTLGPTSCDEAATCQSLPGPASAAVLFPCGCWQPAPGNMVFPLCQGLPVPLSPLEGSLLVTLLAPQWCCRCGVVESPVLGKEVEQLLIKGHGQHSLILNPHHLHLGVAQCHVPVVAPCLHPMGDACEYIPVSLPILELALDLFLTLGGNEISHLPILPIVHPSLAGGR